jgi:hypothetical protein
MILPLQDVCLRCSSDFLKKSYWRGLRADLRKCGHGRLKRFLTDTFSTYYDSRRTQLQFDDMPRPLRAVLAATRPRQVKAGVSSTYELCDAAYHDLAMTGASFGAG